MRSGDVGKRKSPEHDQCDNLCWTQTNGKRPQMAGPQNVFWTEIREKMSEVGGEPDRRCADGRRKSCHERGPPSEKTKNRTERFAQVDIFSACFGKHRSQFSIGQRAGKCEYRANDPDSQYCERTS